MPTVYLPIELAGAPLLVDARAVREVLGHREVVRVPHATLELPGVFPWKGLAIPLIDVGRAMGLPREGAKDQGGRRTVIVGVDEELAGLSADDVREVVTLEEGAVRPVHAAPRPFAQGEVDWGGRVATVLDLRALFASTFARSSREV